MFWLKRFFLTLLTSSIIPVAGLSRAMDEPLPEVEIITVENFSQLAGTAKNQRKLIMLEFAASYCSYCRKLEEEVLKPMLRSGDYDADVLIRKIDIDGVDNLRDFEGRSTSSSTLAHQFDIQVTPTLIFLDSRNQEVSKRIVGVHSLDYFGSYVDKAIEHGLTAIQKAGRVRPVSLNQQ